MSTFGLQAAAERDALKEAAEASTCSKRKREATPDANWCCCICHEVQPVDRYPKFLCHFVLTSCFMAGLRCTVLPAPYIRCVIYRTLQPKRGSAVTYVGISYACRCLWTRWCCLAGTTSTVFACTPGWTPRIRTTCKCAQSAVRRCGQYPQ